MRILMLTDRMESGGAETHVEALALGLTERGHCVSVFSGGGRIADRLEKTGVKQYRYRWAEDWWNWHKNAGRVLKKALWEENFDVLHAHTRRTAFLIKPMERGRMLTVVTVHADFPCHPLLKRIYGWGERTVAVSEDLRAAVCDRFGVPAEAVTVIPNGVDCRRFHPPTADVAPQTVLFASRLDGDCALGAELLCDVAPALKSAFSDLRIRIAGGGDRLKFIRDRAEAVNRRCGENTVTVLGNVENMGEEYRRNAVFVGVSRAAMEAAACGCAVILCGNQGRGGVLSPDDPLPAVCNFCCRGEKLPDAAWLEERLRPLLADGALTRELGARGRMWMRSRYSLDSMARAVEEVYGGRGG